MFRHHGLTLYDVDRLPTHGGSLRVYGRNAEDISKRVSTRALELLDFEERSGLRNLETFAAFAEQVRETAGSRA
jgi:hypothetical protein